VLRAYLLRAYLLRAYLLRAYLRRAHLLRAYLLRAYLLRAGLLLLAAVEGAIGVWATVAPRGFYDGFPLPSHGWLAALPAYSEHFTVDVGALNLGYALLFGVAARHLDRLLVRTALATFLTFTVPHLAYHLTHPAHAAAGTTAIQAVSLASAVVGPLALLALTRTAGSPR
jgi:hypothetical protein